MRSRFAVSWKTSCSNGAQQRFGEFAKRSRRRLASTFALSTAILCGRSSSADILDVYERIPQPVWAVHGVRGDFTDYRRLAPLAAARGWRVTTYPTGALPYFEVGDAFQRDCTAFLDET